MPERKPSHNSNNPNKSHMDTETAKYIINYFSNLLTSEEKIAIKHTSSMFKLEHSSSENPNLKKYTEKKVG